MLSQSSGGAVGGMGTPASVSAPLDLGAGGAMLAEMLRPADRDIILETLKLQGFKVDEVTKANADKLSAYYGGTLGEGNLAWNVIDPVSHKVVKFGVVYCVVGRPPTHRGVIGQHDGKGVIAGDVVIDEHDSILYLKTDTGLLRLNGP